MFSNLKSGWRFLKKQKQFARINILGLTLGFYCFFLLNLFVLHETSFDKDQPNVFRLLQTMEDENGRIRETAQSGGAVGTNATNLFDDIIFQTSVVPIGRTNIGNTPESLTHEPVAIIGDDFFKVFSYKFKEGNAYSLHPNAKGIVMNETLKIKYFGNQNALNKPLKTNYGEFPVLAVLEDFPQNSHFSNGIFFTEQVARGIFNEWDETLNGDWANNNFISYFKLKQPVNAQVLSEKITDLVRSHSKENKQFKSSFHLQAIQDIHLYKNNVEGEINHAKGNGLYVKLFFWIGLIILIVACFNYAALLNITFIDRTKEIGLRQMMGAGKIQLILQFISESLLLTFSAIILSMILIFLTKSGMATLFDTSLSFHQISIHGIILIIGAGVILNLIAVVYPSALILNQNAYRAKQAGSKLPFRKLMLVFQFMAVMCFITGILVFRAQLNYLKTRDAGFERKGLATIDINSGILRNKYEAIKSEFSRIPEVKSVSVTSRVPGEWKNIPMVKVKREGEAISEAEDMLFIGADKDFLSTFDVSLMSGQNFDNKPSDSLKVLINQSAAKILGKSAALGSEIEIPSVNYGGNLETMERPLKAQIAGIVADFQMEDYKTDIKPLVIGYCLNPIHNIDYYTLKIESSNWSKTIADLEQINDSFDPNSPMEFNSLDVKFDRFLEQDIHRFNLLNFFSFIVILLSAMGLFAMAAYVSKSRTKEVGIRKVLGSGLIEIMLLLSKDFVRLIVVALLLAGPISYYLLKKWLEEFAFSIHLGIQFISLSGAIVLLLTLAIIFNQIYKAATTNPILSLKSD